MPHRPRSLGEWIVKSNWINALVGLALLGGCATLSKEECLSGNWREIGVRDGQAGRTADFVAKHAKACEKSGVAPDITLWERGRQQGLPVYCTPQRAYSEGRDGRSLSPVCPAADLVTLQAAHDKGRTYYRLSSDIDDLESDVSDLESEITGEKSAERRATLLLRLNMLQARIRMKEAERIPYSSL